MSSPDTAATAYPVAGVRTPIGRYGGALAGVRTDDLAAHVIRALVAALPSVDWQVLDDVLLGADLVIEAVVEKLDVQRELFARLDRIAPPHAVLASNSSSFVPSRMADATGRPDRVCNLHFFNPALVMRCVEVVRGPATSDTTVRLVVELARRIGKVPVVVEKEIPGFIANRILNAVRDEAIGLLEGGYAGVEAIDTVCRTALGYPMGPFELMDLTGIDIGYLAKQARFAETGDPKDAPSASVTALVEAGHLGRKTGRGWYRYDEHGKRDEHGNTQEG